MSVSKEPISLFNKITKKTEHGFIYDKILEKHLQDIENLWVPKRNSALNKLQKILGKVPNPPQSSHWDWRGKINTISKMLAYKSFAIECGEETQGLMIVDVTRMSRLESQKNKHLVYIEYLESAPWNQKNIVPNPIYKGVGSYLMAVAMYLSREEGFKGRLGLHSLPQADGYYRDFVGMTDMGKDSSYPGSLRYFEMTPEQAKEFLVEKD